MNPKEYIESVLKTESADYEKIKQRISTRRNVRLLHSVIGLCTEVGELQDQVKKHFFYRTELEFVNVREEMGDILWYFALLCDEMQLDFEEIMRINIRKLEERYGKSFSEEKAIERNLEAEREILEDEKEPKEWR